MSKARILIIDDDPEIRDLAGELLREEGYVLSAAGSGEEGLERVGTFHPDLILLDLLLPGLDGLTVCRKLKENAETRAVPVIMLSSKNGEADVVAGLELGAEDYVTKPFNLRILLARVRAVLRRGADPARDAETPIELHGLTIHPGRHEVRYQGEEKRLTPTEFRILQVLAARPGWAFSRYQIVDGVRGEDFAVTDRSVDVQISALRRKLGKAGELIETVRGVGYRIRDGASD